MSALSDIQELYGSVRNAWVKNQADVIAHIVLAVVVFVVFGASLPHVAIPKLDATQISENGWFKLAKDTGLIYWLLIFPVIAVAMYTAVLRTAGKILVAILMVVFPPSPRGIRLSSILGSPTLEPLALTLKKKDFGIDDLYNKSTHLFLKYREKKVEAWEAYQKSISAISQNAQLYLGDFLAFVLIWVMLFQLVPQAEWIQANQSRFWPVVVVALCLAWFAWFRVSRALAFIPSLLIIYVSEMITTDPDMEPLLDVDDKIRDEVRQKLDELVRREHETAVDRPSLRRFLNHQLGFSEAAAKDADLDQSRGLPFRSLYQRGFRFSWDKERYEHYDGRWFADYLAYLYYRLHDRFRNSARVSWQLVRYFVTGAP
jgi:hypothetical protein